MAEFTQAIHTAGLLIASSMSLIQEEQSEIKFGTETKNVEKKEMNK